MSRRVGTRRTATAMTIAWGVLAVLAAPAAGTGDAPQAGTGTAGMEVSRGEDLTRITAELPGPALDWIRLAGRGEGGAGELLVLVGPPSPAAGEPAGRENARQQEDGPRAMPPCEDARGPTALVRIDTGNAELTRLAGELPPDAHALHAARLGGDDRDTLFVLTGDALLQVIAGDGAAAVQARTPIPDGGGELAAFAGGGDGAGRRPWLAVPGMGALRLVRPAGHGEPWQAAGELALPVTGKLTPGGLSVWSQPPSFVGTAPGGALLFATYPVTHGKTRVQVTLVRVAADGAARVEDCWARLPEPEDLLESTVRLLGDRPVLLAGTMPAGKLSLFGEKRLRMFPLRRDRSRLGVLPELALESRMNLWQPATFLLRDADGDGRDDLVVGYWKGLKDDRVVLDAYLRLPGGDWSDRPRTTAFDVKHADRSFLRYGDDVTGDGHADLLLRDQQGALLLFEGRAGDRGAELVERRPRQLLPPHRRAASQKTTVSLGPRGAQVWTDPGGDDVTALDLDGDGRREIVAVQARDEAGHGRVAIVRFDVVRPE